MTRDKGGVLLEYMDNGVRSLARTEKFSIRVCAFIWVSGSLIGWAIVAGTIWELV